MTNNKDDKEFPWNIPLLMNTSPMSLFHAVFSRNPCLPSLSVSCYLQPLKDQLFLISRNGGQNLMPSYNRFNELWCRCWYTSSVMIPVSTFHIIGKHVIGL